MKKKYRKAAKDMMVGGIALGAGMSAMPSGYAKTGVGKLASGMSIAGGVMGAGMVMDAVSDLQKSTKMKKKKRY